MKDKNLTPSCFFFTSGAADDGPFKNGESISIVRILVFIVATCRQQWHYVVLPVAVLNIQFCQYFAFKKEKKCEQKSVLRLEYQFRLILVIVDRLLEAGKNLSARDLDQSNSC